MFIKSINSQLPKVTICVPVRNGARTIQRTLDSLLNQDYPNYEIIVSDNCSDDDTAKIVSQYASSGVKYFFNPTLEKCGESNWNYGQPDALAYYEMDWAIDRMFCAMNLLVQADGVKAMALFPNGLSWTAGVGLFVMGPLGAGVLVGSNFFGLINYSNDGTDNTLIEF